MPGTTFSNLTDDNNALTSISVNLADGFTGVAPLGMHRQMGREIYPEAVMNTGLYETSTDNKRIIVSGLSTSKLYNFVFFNSFDHDLNTFTNFSIKNKSVSLSGTYNINKNSTAKTEYRLMQTDK